MNGNGIFSFAAHFWDKKKRDGWSIVKIELGFVLCGKPLAEEQCVKALCLVTALE